jgi:hypothetical protein
MCIYVLNKLKESLNWAWWHIPIISAVGTLRSEDHKFEERLGSSDPKKMKQ